MNIKFNVPALETERLYASEIIRYELDEEQNIFKIYIALDDIPELEFCKSYIYSESTYSELAQFCRDMCILTPENTANMDRLEGTKVCVMLRRGANGEFFINEIFMDENYFEEFVGGHYDFS